jgi:predicted TIM-barrel fold metal-dependent hydrolase
MTATHRAVARMEIETMPLISADSHVEEPPGLWVENLHESAKAALPLEMSAYSESQSAFALRISAADASKLTEDELEGMRHRQRTASLGTTSVEARYQIMREDGIAGECIYPTAGLYLWNIEDPEVGKSCARIYNDWILDTLEARSPRFRCAGLVPTWNVRDAMDEVLRIVERGLAAVMLPLVGTPPYNHRDWEPLWSLIEDTGRPIVMHQGSGHDMLFYRGRGAAVANLLATQSMAPRTAALLATSGVLANHPGLHFVFVETNAGWLAWLMSTLDHYNAAFKQNPGWVRPMLPEPPSFYVKRQLHATFQNDEVAIGNIAKTGSDPLLWGSDYPHTEGTYPHSRKVVSVLCAGLEPAETAAIVCDTAVRLFDFESSVLTDPV